MDRGPSLGPNETSHIPAAQDRYSFLKINSASPGSS